MSRKCSLKKVYAIKASVKKAYVGKIYFVDKVYYVFVKVKRVIMNTAQNTFQMFFYVAPINKHFLLSNALNLRFRGSQRLQRKQSSNTVRKARYTHDTLLY